MTRPGPVVVRDDRPRRGRAPHPDEVDLVGRLAGLGLGAHYRDWRGTPIGTSQGLTNVVSVLRKPI